MTVTIISFVFIVAVLCTCLVVLFEDRDKDVMTPFIVVLAMLILASVMLGVSLHASKDVESKDLVNPSIEIKCVDGKCDTTYVYKFNQE